MSGSPSRNELVAMLQNAADVFEDTRAFHDGTLLGLIDTLEQSSEGDFLPSGIVAYANSVRSAASSMIAPGTNRLFLNAFLSDWGKLAASPGAASDPVRLIQDLYQYFVDNSERVESRAITYSTPSAGGGNTGGGLFSRLTVDENGFNLEGVTVEAKKLICRRDQTTGARRGEETFELHGVEPSPDSLGWTSAGSGVQANITVRHGGTGQGGSLLVNSSFDEEHDTDDTSTTKVAGWEITSNPANIEEALGSASANNIFIEAPDVTTDNSRSLQFEGNATIRQLLSGTQARNLDSRVPYFCRVMVRRQNSCDGTLTLSMGSHSIALTVSTHTDDTWEELLLTVNSNCWPKNFYEDEIDISLALASRTTGDLLVDDLHFGPMDLVDGSYYLLRTGATPFTLDDVFTWTDTGGAPTTAKIQYMLYRSGLGYLPSASDSTITVADP